MKIADSVKIGGLEYSVKQVPLISENKDLLGEIVYKEQTIEIKSTMKPEQDYTKQVFLHEILHGIYEFCGIEQDENNIDCIAKALYQVIKDNPQIFEGGEPLAM